MNQVFFQAWRVNVGRVPVYLLDTNRPENEQHFRDLTLRVYGGDSTTRIMQEILLGIGGVRLAARAGHQAFRVPHERRACGVSDAGIDSGKNGWRERPSQKRSTRNESGMHFHDAHAGRSRARPVQPGFDGLRDAAV